MSYILGPKILSRLIFLDLVFCLFKFMFWGSFLAENLYFWIHLAYNKEELNEKILNGQGHVDSALSSFHIEM